MGELWGTEPLEIDTSRDESSSSLPGYRAKAVEMFAGLLPALKCSRVEAK